jgi:hypothetical protein
VPRPPKTPWINPARRTRALTSGIVAAVILLGGGIGIGVAIGDTGGSSHPRFAPASDRGGFGANLGRGAQRDHRGPGGPYANNRPGGQQPTATTVPSTAPTSSASPK